MMSQLGRLFWVFFKIGAFTFGGGIAMLPIIEREMINNKWVSPDEMMDYVVISQSSPGAIAVNISILCGYKVGRFLGALVAMLGVVLPSLITITVIGLFIANFNEIVWFQKALQGINVAVVILLLDAIIKLGARAIKDWQRVLLMGLVFSAVYFLKFSVPLIIGILIGLGTLIYGYQLLTVKKKVA